ncbi:recombinase family protein [Burkholderia contaminans]|uniref:recombinase family protein n=1 Tax=Burkholderia contaminans TaxID=488447 RepID=UPI002FC2D242
MFSLNDENAAHFRISIAQIFGLLYTDNTLDERPLMLSKGQIMANGKFVAYYRVSTQKQGASGLGLDAQREAVARYLNGGDWELVGEFTETETGKGANALAMRPQLRAALDLCRKIGARLLIAKLDRLARNVHFISGLMESKVQFVACDMPEANELTIHIMAAFAEHEAKRISERTKDALRAAKARGVVLGATGSANLKQNIEARQTAANTFAESLSPVLSGFKASGLNQRQMVEQLNKLGIKTVRGGEWSLMQLQRVLKRIA